MRKFPRLVFVLSSFVSPASAQAPAQPNDYTAHVVGCAHMDMAWLWRGVESIYDIMYNTLHHQLEWMDQFPDYTYAQHQAGVLEFTTDN